jgi:hypothetical protein
LTSKLKFKLLLHQTYYSPDLNPFDYQIFRPLKDALYGCQFASTEEIKGTVHMMLQTQPKTFFTDGIRKLMDLSNKCVGKLGDYIKKLQYICSCIPFVK